MRVEEQTRQQDHAARMDAFFFARRQVYFHRVLHRSSKPPAPVLRLLAGVVVTLPVFGFDLSNALLALLIQPTPHHFHISRVHKILFIP
jgi:hypothetical protein